MPRWPKENLRLKGKMAVTTVNIPTIWFEIFDKLKELGVYPSRSQMIRTAIRDWLFKEMNLYSKFIEPLLEAEDINVIKVPNGDGTYQQLFRIGEA